MAEVLPMTEIEELEQALATEFYQAVQDWSNQTERSLQDQDKVIGVSSIGHCSEYVRRMLADIPASSPEPDKLAAFNGTWIGAGVEQAILAKRPDAIIQSEVNISLETDQGTFTITGHPDLLLPAEGVVIDNKTVNLLASVTAYDTFGTNLQKRIQRHLYALGAWQKGLFGDIPLEEIKVGNLWVDRSATDHEFLVRLELFSWEVIEQAKDWLSTVVYAYKHNIEAPKEPSRAFCENWCEQFADCRAADTDVEGLIDDPVKIRAIDIYHEGSDLMREGKKLQTVAKEELTGISGSTGEWVLRWTEVSPSEIPATTRRGYRKITISKAK